MSQDLKLMYQPDTFFLIAEKAIVMVDGHADSDAHPTNYLPKFPNNYIMTVDVDLLRGTVTWSIDSKIVNKIIYKKLS